MYVIRYNKRYISSRQVIFRPMQFTDKLKNAMKFKSSNAAIGYANVHTYGRGVVYEVVNGRAKYYYSLYGQR